VGGKRRVAVRAEHPKVLYPVVVGDAVDVVEHHRHALTEPDLSLAAEFADGHLRPGGKKPPFEIASRVARMLNQNLFEWDPARSRTPPDRDAGIEMIRRDVPFLGPSLDGPVVVALDAVPQEAQHMEPALRLFDSGPEVFF
jgi:hypothetical protein